MFTPFAFVKSAAVAAANDADAQAFINATGISGTDATAINTLVVDLKAASLWTKMLAIYPFVGGTSNTNSYNLKNTGSFQITWNGTVTFSANGVQSDGTTGYGATGFVPSTVNSTTPITTSFHGSIYSRTAAANNSADFGVDTGTPQFQMLSKRSTGNFLGDNYTEATRINVSFAENSQGLFTLSRTSQVLVTGLRNAAVLGTESTSIDITQLPTSQIFVLAASDAGTAVDFSTRQLAWTSFGTGLSNAEVSSLYTVVQAYQTTLSRQV
jgi:hypothetical protein